jgi:hypothetical protein
MILITMRKCLFGHVTQMMKHNILVDSGIHPKERDIYMRERRYEVKTKLTLG